MEVSSTYRYAKISAFKAREVTRAIQGLPVSAALDVVAFSPKKAATMIGKTLKSAIAKATIMAVGAMRVMEMRLQSSRSQGICEKTERNTACGCDKLASIAA